MRAVEGAALIAVSWTDVPLFCVNKREKNKKKDDDHKAV
jgi:hypothetical protein